jgi:phosphoserine phosphatase RsbU/P
MNRISFTEGFRRFFNFRGLAWRMGFLFLTGIAIITIFSFFYVIVYSYRMLLNEAQTTAGDKASLTSNRIGNVIRPVEEVANVLTHSLRFENNNFKEVHLISSDYVVESPVVYGSIMAFEPEMYKKGKKFHADYVYQPNNVLKDIILERPDYDYFTYEWYSRPKQEGKACWSEPYYDRGAGDTLMCTYSVPFYKTEGKNKQFAGVLTMDISLAILEKIVSSVHVYKSGFALMVSRKGVVITSPVPEYINKRLLDVIVKRQKGSKPGPEMNASVVAVATIAQKAGRGESGFLKVPRLVNTGSPGWIYFTPVGSTGWSLLIIFPEDELFSNMYSFLRNLIVVIFLSILAALVVTIFSVRRFTRPITRLATAARDVGQGNFNLILPVYRSKDEISQLSNSFSLMQEELRSYLVNLKASTAARERIESEIAVARDLQQGLLPSHFPSVANCDLHALLVPARMVGGDLYDFFFLDEDHLCFAIGDVSGKGVPGSLFMAITRTLFRSYMTAERSPDEVMAIVNRELCRENPNLMFVTFQAGILNLTTGILVFCNAGHTRPYIVTKSGKATAYTCNPGLPLGIDETFTYSAERITLNYGDLLVLYTDGVTEAANEQEELYRDIRLVKVLESIRKSGAREISEALVKNIRDFSGMAEQSDDIALIILKYTGKSTPVIREAPSEKLVLQNTVPELHKIAGFIGRLSEDYGFSSKISTELNLVLEELVSNIIFYAYEDDAVHEIVIEFSPYENGIEVMVTDDGRPFNLLEKPDPYDPSGTLESRKIGGIGIHFIRTLTDSIKYIRKDNKNRITFTRIINHH